MFRGLCRGYASYVEVILFIKFFTTSITIVITSISMVINGISGIPIIYWLFGLYSCPVVYITKISAIALM